MGIGTCGGSGSLEPVATTRHAPRNSRDNSIVDGRILYSRKLVLTAVAPQRTLPPHPFPLPQQGSGRAGDCIPLHPSKRRVAESSIRFCERRSAHRLREHDPWQKRSCRKGPEAEPVAAVLLRRCVP